MIARVISVQAVYPNCPKRSWPKRNHDSALSAAATEDIHYLSNLLALVLLVAAFDRVFNAVAYVVPQYLFFCAAQSRAHGGNLRYDIYAIAVFLDHA
jgi:hypothetical protein